MQPVANHEKIADVLEDGREKLVTEFNAVHLFDLPSGSSIYRVFMLPGGLQFDLSFAPSFDFGAIGPKFKLLFGNAVEKPHIASAAARDLFGCRTLQLQTSNARECGPHKFSILRSNQFQAVRP